MNNNLEFENTDPSPDSVEDNHPRTNYGEGYYEEPKQETLKEAVVIEKIAMDKLKNKWGHLYIFGYPQRPFPTNYENDLNNIKIGLYEGAEWKAERMYSEEEVEIIITKLMHEVHTGDICYGNNVIDFKISPRKWFEQFKKK
jgi:hypothetical protein